MRQITSGLEHLHLKEIVHCNLKPANIQISFPDGTVGPLMKLTNFGMLRIVKDGAMILTRELLKNVDDATGVLELIGSMLNVSPSQKPSATGVLTHPFLVSQTSNTFYPRGFAG